MDKLEVSYRKLLNYVSGNTLYKVLRVNDNVDLVFTADFPEAESHSRGEPARIVFYGKLVGERVVFEKVVVDEGEKLMVKDPEEALYAYSPWLQYIEDNY